MSYDFSIGIRIGIRPLLVVNKIGQDPVGIDISKSLNKKELAKSITSFDIFNRFIAYKKLSTEYYSRFMDIYDGIIIMTREEMNDSLNNLLSIFHDEDILEFLRYEKYETPDLPEEFDNNKILNKEATREQSYTKSDYLKLIVLIIKLKAISPIIARYISIMNIDVNNSSALTIYHLVSRLTKIEDDEAFIKLMEFIDKHINKINVIDESTISRVLNKNITKDSFKNFIGVSIILYLGIVSTTDGEGGRSIIVSNIHRLCMNKTAPSKNILINKPKIMADDDGNTSVTDAFQSLTELPLGYIQTAKYAYRNREVILRQQAQTNIPIDLKILSSLDKYRKTLEKTPICRVHIAIICWLSFSIMESKTVESLDRDVMMEFRLISAAILYTNGINKLGDIMMSSPISDGVYINKPSNKKCDLVLENRLDEVFGVSVNKKPRSRQYGLSLLDSGVTENDNSLKELLLKPMIMDLSSVRWYNHTIPHSDVYEYTSPREELIKTMILVHENIQL